MIINIAGFSKVFLAIQPKCIHTPTGAILEIYQVLAYFIKRIWGWINSILFFFTISIL